MEKFSGLFEAVEDPRRSNATRHDLHETPMSALLSMLCGGEGCADMERFGRAGASFLRGFMTPKRGGAEPRRFLQSVQCVGAGGLAAGSAAARGRISALKAELEVDPEAGSRRLLATRARAARELGGEGCGGAEAACGVARGEGGAVADPQEGGEGEEGAEGFDDGPWRRRCSRRRWNSRSRSTSPAPSSTRHWGASATPGVLGPERRPYRTRDDRVCILP